MTVHSPRDAKFAATKGYNAYQLAAIVVGTKAVNTINVTVQLKEAGGQNVSKIVAVSAYLSDNADGSTLTATVPTSTVAIGTNGLILVVDVTNKVFQILTNATGQFDLNLIQTNTATTYYLVLVLPDGSLLVSGAIAFT